MALVIVSLRELNRGFPLRRVGYIQDERYIAGEHMDVRRDCVKFARL